MTGTGWGGQPNHDHAPYYSTAWRNSKWSGFDTNDSPYYNATWEDWEKWYHRGETKSQHTVYTSNSGFLTIVVSAVFLGAYGQSLLIEQHDSTFKTQIRQTNDHASFQLRSRREASQDLVKNDRVKHFLTSRHDTGYGAWYTEEPDETVPEKRMGIQDDIPKQEEGTDTYLVGTGSDRLLVDTGEGKPSWFAALSSVLKAENATISHALLTHWHPDHVGGCGQLHQICPNAIIHENEPAEGTEDIADGESFKTEGATLRAFYCPGHTTNHMAFVLEEESAMFTGDNVLGHGTAVFEDLPTYLQSLERMKEQFTGRAYPGHGAVIEDGPARIREYLVHRKEREQQVLQVLKDLDEQGGATPMEIVKVVYKDYPENLWEPAAKGVLAILQKLEGEGKAEHVGNDKWRITKKPTL
ncbi:uncharacterized protein KY384_005862 [Bacidia gigantensis]|uniref:uncharacterized protein n=1 Tax=Bacidia gigantensis TaxID=2732470 RepID=UPI001D03B45D|nr:uncharacterized protein KY384_005862 [Bacidia gigantensis]KAG8529227.1 hypothetical protein KY384_005862 [Bacidia gigantensis]